MERDERVEWLKAYRAQHDVSLTVAKKAYEQWTEHKACPSHCCQKHGCKYNHLDCPVVLKLHPGIKCEDCYTDDARKAEFLEQHPEFVREHGHHVGLDVAIKHLESQKAVWSKCQIPPEVLLDTLIKNMQALKGYKLGELK